MESPLDNDTLILPFVIPGSIGGLGRAGLERRRPPAGLNSLTSAWFVLSSVYVRRSARETEELQAARRARPVDPER